MGDVKWFGDKVQKIIETKALDGVEELAIGPIKTSATERCPVAERNGGTLRNSIGTERDDKNKCVRIGAGGAAKDYAFIQHQRTDFNHTTGEAKFIQNAVDEYSKDLTDYIKKHVDK